MKTESTYTKDGRLRAKYRKRFAEMAKWVAKSARKKNDEPFFDYNKWFYDKDHTVLEAIEHPCGTAGCIGGWAMIFRAADEGLGDQIPSSCPIYDDKYAAQYLGLSEEDACTVFYGSWHSRQLDAPVKEIITMLRSVARTGRVPERVAL